MNADILDWVRTTPLCEVVPGIWYAGYIDDLPDLYVGRLPPSWVCKNDDSEINNSYQITFVENDVERRIVEQSLRLPLKVTTDGMVDFRPTIGRVNLTPSTLPRGEIRLALYPPAAAGWPWWVVFRNSFNVSGKGLCRMRYGIDGFATEAEGLSNLSLLASMTRAAGAEQSVVSPDRTKMS